MRRARLWSQKSGIWGIPPNRLGRYCRLAVGEHEFPTLEADQLSIARLPSYRYPGLAREVKLCIDKSVISSHS